MPLTIALAIMSIISGIATLVAVPGFFYAAGLQRSYTAPKPSAMSTTYGDYSGDALREDCEAIPATITRTGVPPMSRAEMVRIINKAALDFKISPTIIAAIIRQESTYDAEAQSGVGAGGLMQFMSDTWQDEYKIDTYKTSFAALIAANSKLDPANYPDNRFNPGANVYFGTGYIKKQIDYFKGDTSKGLAAYNAGAGNVEKYGGIPPFSETQNYVSKITQSISEFEKCLEKSSINVQGVAARAISKVGKPSSSFCAWDPRNACASVVSDVLIEEGILASNEKRPGVAGLAVKLYGEKGYTTVITDPSDLQPGDIVFMNTHSPDGETDSLYTNEALRRLVSQRGEPYHVGIWVENGNSSNGLVDNSTGGGQVVRRGLWTPMTFALRR